MNDRNLFKLVIILNIIMIILNLLVIVVLDLILNSNIIKDYITMLFTLKIKAIGLLVCYFGFQEPFILLGALFLERENKI
jgi:hypothetical protein